MSEMFMIRGRPPLSAALALLQSNGLPASDIKEEHLEHFFFSGADGSPNGLVGVAMYDRVALLRSLVVDEKARSRGLGAALVQKAERYAVSKGVGSMYLLTNTAEQFFIDLGYQRVDRALAPEFIRATREFAELCPASSAFLVKSLQQEG